MTSPGIETATFLLVSQCLHQLPNRLYSIFWHNPMCQHTNTCFFLQLFNDAVRSFGCIAQEETFISEQWISDVVGSCRDLIWGIPGIYLEGLWKTTQALIQCSRFPDRYMKKGPLAYEAGGLAARTQLSIKPNSTYHTCVRAKMVERLGRRRISSWNETWLASRTAVWIHDWQLSTRDSRNSEWIR